MSHLALGIAAGLGVAVLLVVVLLTGRLRRSSRRVGEVEQRLDELAADLGSALERTEEGGRQTRLLVDISASIDLDEVLAATLEAIVVVPGVDAALVRVESPDGPPTVAARGLPDEEAARQAAAAPPESREVRAIEFTYRYAEADETASALVRGGLAVPLADKAGRLGHLIAFARAADRRFGEQELLRLEEIAHRAAPAIENARRFREAQRLADLDALTELHNRRYFHEMLGREVARAQRYARKLSVIVFDLDDFKSVNDRIGHLAADAVLAEAAARVRDVVRSADVPCRVGGDEFAVIMPESELEDAEQLFARIQNAVGSRPIGEAGRLRSSGGLAELRTDDDSISLFERADQALYRAKEAGKGRAISV